MNQDYFKLIKYRESMYRLFSSIYIEEISREMLDKLIALRLPKIRKPEQNWQMDFNAGYELLENYLKGFKDDSEEEIAMKLEYLAADYAKIFLAAGEADGKAAFPYESVYVGNDSEFGGSIQENLKALYASKGLRMKEDMFKIMEDHVGLEFNYMAELLAAQAEAVKEEDEEASAKLLKEQVSFFRAHIMNWITSFTNDIYKYADRDFYRGVARMTSGYIGFEQAVLKDREVAK